jgi:hypothetical protein
LPGSFWLHYFDLLERRTDAAFRDATGGRVDYEQDDFNRERLGIAAINWNAPFVTSLHEGPEPGVRFRISSALGLHFYKPAVDFLFPRDRALEPSAPPGAAAPLGRPPNAAMWQAIAVELALFVNDEGFPGPGEHRQARLIKELLDRLSTRGVQAGERSTVQPVIVEFLRRLDKEE